jgi:hypothetical protein
MILGGLLLETMHAVLNVLVELLKRSYVEELDQVPPATHVPKKTRIRPVLSLTTIVPPSGKRWLSREMPITHCPLAKRLTSSSGYAATAVSGSLHCWRIACYFAAYSGEPFAVAE